MPARNKPPYAIPSMADVRAAAGTNGLTVASTFSGAGGSCLGFEIEGYRVVYASEFVPAAREVYELNHPGVPVDARDVRDVVPDDVLRAAGLYAGDLDVLEGSPPCASFSMAGKRDAHWGDVKRYSDVSQRTDDLFFEFARLLGGLAPRAFVAENVSGLTIGKARGYFKEIHAALAAAGPGYVVEARMLDAQWLGVPQARRRVIFVGVRRDLGASPRFPVPLPYRYTIADACPWISTVRIQGSVERSNRPAPTVQTHGRKLTHSEFVAIEEEAQIDGMAIGREWRKMRPGEQSAKYFQLVRPDPRAPSPTVTASGGATSIASVTHPTECRKFSIAELKRICGFPDDFTLAGTYAQQWERLGRAVPPPMMRAVAREVRHVLNGRPRSGR